MQNVRASIARSFALLIKEAVMPLPSPKQFARVGDLDIAYEFYDFTDPWDTREPETFLLYPGYCRTTEFWRAWPALLGRHYRVLALDARGYGDTTKPPPEAPLSLDILVGDAIGLMDALGIPHVHWVGESTGGALGLMAGILHPGRIRTVTLLNTAAKFANETTSTYAVGEADQAAALAKYGVAEWCRLTLKYRMDMNAAPTGMQEWVPQQMGKTPAHIAIAAFRIFSTVDLMPRLTEVKVPVLLIVGSRCATARHAHMAEMRDRLPRAKLAIVEGLDQGLHFLAPDAVVSQIKEFLKDLS
jgi:pimeloyl-ACP methyl ester carboxylesterase